MRLGITFAAVGLLTAALLAAPTAVSAESMAATPTFTGSQLPTFTGTPEVGKPLTIVNGSDWAPTPDAVWYQWYRSDSATPGGSWVRIVEGSRRTSRTPRRPLTRESTSTSV